jgi:Amt family ammonium transporter
VSILVDMHVKLFVLAGLLLWAVLQGGPAGPSSTGTHFSEQCVSELHGLETWTTEDGTLELSVELLKYAVDQVWLLVAAIWVFQMQTGFTLLEAGGVRVKNTKAIIIKNFLDTCLGALVWYFVGYPLGYSDGNAFLGYTWDSLSSCTDHVHWFFTWSFAATSATILSGAVAERCQMQAYLVIAAVLTGVVHPVCAHWVWTSEGWLSPGKMGPNGFIDTAGSGVVHLVGGVAALAAAAILGPRYNWTAVESSGPLFTGHSSVLTTLGTFILWVSWYVRSPPAIPPRGYI